MVNPVEILKKYEIVVNEKSKDFIKDVYSAIEKSDDPVSLADHVILFDYFWKEFTKNKVLLSDKLKLKIIKCRSRIPNFFEIAKGFLVRKDEKSLKELCDLTYKQEQEVWSIFHTLVPQFSTRNSDEVDKILGIYSVVESMHGKINVLDIGCGSHGRAISTLVSKYPRIAGFGIDLDIQAFPSNVELVCGSALKLPFKDDFFDIVYAAETIYYFEDEKLLKMVSEALRVLKVGGVFVFNDHRFSVEDYKKLFAKIKISVNIVKYGLEIFTIVKTG